MNKKYLRLGCTETSLLFFYWYCNNIDTKNQRINDGKYQLIKWLYTTSGYYDKKISSNYMDATHKNVDPEIYIKYMEILMNFIKDADNFHFGVHYDTKTNEFNNFLKSLNIKNNVYMGTDFIFNLIKDQKVLFISPFANLFKKQIENGNVNKIYDKFTKPSVAFYYTNIYTFFNKGPHNDILDTTNFLYEDIINNVENNYDIVIISAGAYSNILAKKFYENNKTVCTLGGDLQDMFGIMNNRNRKNNLQFDNAEYWITEIPDEYKPTDYKKIENGCYW